jgi:hypothetical protein
MPLSTAYQIVEALLSVQAPQPKPPKGKKRRGRKVPNGPLGSPGDALVKKSGLPYGTGFACPGGGR